MIKTLFALTIGQDEDTGGWRVVVHSAVENKHTLFDKPSLKAVMLEAYKRMRKRALLNKRFPVERKRIITLAQSRPLIVAANGR